jgi:hypothetical protein
VAAENLYQHAEHYFRIGNTGNDGNQRGASPRPDSLAGVVTSEAEQGSGDADSDSIMECSQTGWGDHRPGFL